MPSSKEPSIGGSADRRNEVHADHAQVPRMPIVIACRRLLVAFSFASLQLGCASATEPPPRFVLDTAACPKAKKVWSERELRELVVQEGNKRGPPLDVQKLKFSISQEGCELIVWAFELPRRPGGHFGIVFAADRGEVVRFMAGG